MLKGKRSYYKWQRLHQFFKCYPNSYILIMIWIDIKIVWTKPNLVRKTYLIIALIAPTLTWTLCPAVLPASQS